MLKRGQKAAFSLCLDDDLNENIWISLKLSSKGAIPQKKGPGLNLEV